MIWLIIGCALFIFCSYVTVFEQEINLYTKATEKLKWTCQNASTDGSYFYNLEEYGDGYLVFNYDESMKSIKKSVQDSLNLDDSLLPVGQSYWDGAFVCDIFFYDESNVVKHYTDFNLTSTDSFTFPVDYTDDGNTFSTTISEPTIVVRLTNVDKDIRVKGLPDLVLSRTASCESPER